MPMGRDGFADYTVMAAKIGHLQNESSCRGGFITRHYLTCVEGELHSKFTLIYLKLFFNNLELLRIISGPILSRGSPGRGNIDRNRNPVELPGQTNQKETKEQQGVKINAGPGKPKLGSIYFCRGNEEMGYSA